MKKTNQLISCSLKFLFGLAALALLQGCTKYDSSNELSGTANLDKLAVTDSGYQKLSNDSCFPIVDGKRGSGCQKPETYVWNFKNCIYPVGCVGFPAGNGKDAAYSHIPEPDEVCNASNARRVVTSRVITNAGTTDYLLGCRSTRMPNDKFLNMMNQNSMATYIFDRRTSATTATVGSSTPAIAPATTSAGTRTNEDSGSQFAGVQGPGGPSLVTYDWYFPAAFDNNYASGTSWKIPAACTASTVGTVVTIKDPAMADRRFMCLPSNHDRKVLSGIFSVNPTYKYEYVNGQLISTN